MSYNEEEGKVGIGLHKSSKSTSSLISLNLSSTKQRPNVPKFYHRANQGPAPNNYQDKSPRMMQKATYGYQQQAQPSKGDHFILSHVTGDDSTASSEMSSIREEPKTRAQRIPQSHGLNTVISNKKLSFVDLDTVCNSDSKTSSSSSLQSMQPRSTKNMQSQQNRMFNEGMCNDTDDIDQPHSARENNQGINVINDTIVPSKQAQKETEINNYSNVNQQQILEMNKLVEERIAAARCNERQIKYLGLVIEKDDEQIIDPTDIENFTFAQRNNLQALLNQPVDVTKRAYEPIRERYIKIVKGSRKLCIDCFEKRGRKDFKRTAKSLSKVGQSIGYDQDQY